MFVPDGLYALYHVNREGVKQSIDIFDRFGYGDLTFAKAKEIIPSFVQISNQSVDGRQVVSLRLAGNGKYLSDMEDGDDRFDGRFEFRGDSMTPFEFITPENTTSYQVDRLEQNCSEICGIFKVTIRCLTSDKKNIVHPFIDYRKKSKGIFILEKRFHSFYFVLL